MNLFKMNQTSKPDYKFNRNLASKSSAHEKQLICMKLFIGANSFSLKEVSYLHRRNDHTDIITICNNSKFYIKNEEFDYLLIYPNFIRIHEDFIVNIDQITRANYHSIYVGRIELPIVKKFKKALFDKLNVIA